MFSGDLNGDPFSASLISFQKLSRKKEEFEKEEGGKRSGWKRAAGIFPYLGFRGQNRVPIRCHDQTPRIFHLRVHLLRPPSLPEFATPNERIPPRF